jgi:hypothetical protein
LGKAREEPDGAGIEEEDTVDVDTDDADAATLGAATSVLLAPLPLLLLLLLVWGEESVEERGTDWLFGTLLAATGTGAGATAGATAGAGAGGGIAAGSVAVLAGLLEVAGGAGSERSLLSPPGALAAGADEDADAGAEVAAVVGEEGVAPVMREEGTNIHALNSRGETTPSLLVSRDSINMSTS